ncbi:hypothetical protein F4776DRAFT_670131 [Hypoxylon sp. NC0597]|nr:hypothetical protein F4776DRAFT_670131 [Hypoxylon sp. NC0597]
MERIGSSTETVTVGGYPGYHTHELPKIHHASENGGRVFENGILTNKRKQTEEGGPKPKSARVDKDAMDADEDEDVLDSVEESDDPEDVLEESDSLISELLVENPIELLTRYKRILMGASVTRKSEIKDEASSVKDAPSIKEEAPTVKEEAPVVKDSPATTPEKDTNADEEKVWRYEQIFINQILKGRNEYTLMPTTWKMHFRGIPLPEGLFYTKTRAVSTRPRIYGRTQSLEYRGAIALRRLFDLHSRIRDTRNAGERSRYNYTSKIVELIKRRLTDALRWAELDGDIAKYKHHLPSNVKIVEIKDADGKDMDVQIQDEMNDLAEEWREVLVDIPEQERPKAPVLFGFVVYQHILSIITLDAEDPDAICHIPCQLNLSKRNQHQWNAMAIMVTICWARDLFEGLAHKIPQIGDFEQSQHSDPDA